MKAPRTHLLAMEAPRQAKRRRLTESSLEDLPDELLFEILIRISDYKCLFRCKSVCKLWFSLISQTYFGCRYLGLHPSMNKIPENRPFTFIGYSCCNQNPESIFSRESIFQSPGFSFNFLHFSFRILIMETFNDLVLCYDSMNLRRQQVYYICNPLTMQWMALPPAPITELSVNLRNCFICEPSCKEDPIQEHLGIAFKVVRILHTTPDLNRVGLQIFSSKTGQWNQTTLSLPQNFALLVILEAVICNNGAKLILLGLTLALRQVVSITVEGENFDQYRITIIPSVDLFSTDVTQLKLCKRNLRLAHLDWLHILQIWELQGWDEWKLVQSDFIHNKIIELLDKDYKTNQNLNASVLGFHPHDRNVLYLNLNFHGRVASYDLRRRTLNLVPNICLDNFQSTVYPYVLPLWPTPIPQI